MGVDVEPLVADERSEALVRAPGRPLLGYALGRVDRPEDAADVVADTMLVAWRRLDEVLAGGDARPWLFGVARRALANSRRGLPRRDRLGERLRTELGQQVAADHAAAVETDLAVRVALAGLDADDREVLLLTTWEGLEVGERVAVFGRARGDVEQDDLVAVLDRWDLGLGGAYLEGDVVAAVVARREVGLERGDKWCRIGNRFS
jgi:DNA-directed RNA polymerase specialized sigma24 family protein